MMSTESENQKKKPKLEMKRIVILLYLNEKGSNYVYKDLKELVSLDFQRLDEIIQKLIEEKYLNYTEREGYSISEQGKHFLNTYDITDLKITEHLESEKEIRVSMNPNFSEMYIPRDFDSKV